MLVLVLVLVLVLDQVLLFCMKQQFIQLQHMYVDICIRVPGYSDINLLKYGYNMNMETELVVPVCTTLTGHLAINNVTKRAS